MDKKGTSIFRSIGLTSKLLGVYINDQMLEKGIDLTRNQYVLLKVLLEKEGSTQNDLAFLTERDKTSMARLVNAMENKGLIKKVTGKQDRRQRQIYLTEAGKKMLARAIPLMKDLEIKITEELGVNDLQTTINVLQSVQTKVSGPAPGLT